jgi:hypothetical protein
MKPVILLTSLVVLVLIGLSDLQSGTAEKSTGPKEKVIEVAEEKYSLQNKYQGCLAVRNSGPTDPNEKSQISSRIPSPSFSGKMVNYFILIF